MQNMDQSCSRQWRRTQNADQNCLRQWRLAWVIVLAAWLLEAQQVLTPLEAQQVLTPATQAVEGWLGALGGQVVVALGAPCLGGELAILAER